MNWNLSWTLASIGFGWLFVSCAVALALGRMIQRSKASIARDAVAGIQPASEFGGIAEDDDNDLDDTGSRAASGTRLRAVRMDDTQTPERKVS